MATTVLWQGEFCGGFIKIFQDEPNTVSFAYVSNEFEFGSKIVDVAQYSGMQLIEKVREVFDHEYHYHSIRQFNSFKILGVQHVLH